jgi:hypothetical protein
MLIYVKGPGSRSYLIAQALFLGLSETGKPPFPHLRLVWDFRSHGYHFTCDIEILNGVSLWL